ncbi:hypothetical protein VNI00_015720 [Paramarasmius palmivorus]|uniref:Uncharacterized protein n=1 Tax=Paramarasmius palmivorus TaxID=297713 RepID=A0AAW0BI95_9AGAR
MSVAATLTRSNNSQFQSSRFGLSVFGLNVNHKATSSRDSRRSLDSSRTVDTLTEQQDFYHHHHQLQPHPSRPGVVDSVTPSIPNQHRDAQDRRLDRSVSHRITRDKGKSKEQDIMNTAPRRHPVRVEADGPWSVSVAESPHDARSYSIYIKTPTHNLTLTRTAMELVDLHQKLQDTIPSAKLPALPLDPSTIPATTPAKRKSAFLNTLSRLASPSANKTGRRSSLARRTNNSSAAPSITASGLPSPAQSPSVEVNDPFQSFTNSNDIAASLPAPSVQATALASYLTTVSNMVGLRQTRVWRRFVRVRTDDLESVRVERAIKRVRSDLAGYTGIEKKDKKEEKEKSREEKENVVPTSTTDAMDVVHEKESTEKPTSHSQEQTVSGSGQGVDRDEVKPMEVDVTSDAATTDEPSKAAESQTDLTTTTSGVSTTSAIVVEPSTPRPSGDEPRTPSASQPSSLASSMSSVSASSSSAPMRSGNQRSQSADPDKRISRAFLSSATSTNRESGMSSTSQTETEDDSSTHNSQRRSRRKKRNDSDAALKEKKKSSRKVGVTDFEMLRVLGKGCAGKVLLVRHKATEDLYAMKAITKRHVLAHQELQHTLTEQAVLKRMANGPGDGKERDPFVVKLWWSFHDKENLFLVMDFHPGGDLATQLARWGRLGRDRARFYAAEIVEGVEGLHAAGVIYRDLKPENILIGGDGHIVLTDFGLSKEFPRRTSATTAPSTPSGTRDHENTQPPWMKGTNGVDLAVSNPTQSDMTSTFCGTAEYLAPEVIQGLPYSYEVDWWSFGTMLFEMLTGITPFWANNHSDMYVRVLQDELQFPDDRALDQDTKSLIRGLLQRNPALRLCEPRIKRHPYFSMIDWSHVYYKRYIPPYIPPIDPSVQGDTQNFDDTFLDMEPVLDEYIDENSETDQDQGQNTDTDRTDGEESNTTPSQSRSSSLRPQPNQPPQEEEESVDVFDGYSFKGRHSVILDDEEDSSEEEVTDEEEEESIHTNGDVLSGLENLSGLEPEVTKPVVEDEVAEPKTPEARPVVLPPEAESTPDAATPAIPPKDVAEIPDEVAPEALPAEPATIIVKEETPSRKSKEEPTPLESVPTAPAPSTTTPTSAAPPATPEKDVKTKPVETKPTVPPKGLLPPKANRNVRRKERSGIPALDRYLSDAGEDAEATERDDEDDDWDFVEMDDDGEDRNGKQGTSLFARGVVDKYRLAVFSRKASTPQRASVPRSASGMSKDSEVTPSESGDSPSPSVRRGRNAGLTFKKHPRQFLRPKSPAAPPSSFSGKSAKSLSYSTSATLSTRSSSGMLNSSSTSSTLPVTPSLKSKESALSMGARSQSSDNSGNGDAVADTNKEPEQKNKKLKKYKENAEKMFSIFSPSPRQPTS